MSENTNCPCCNNLIKATVTISADLYLELLANSRKLHAMQQDRWDKFIKSYRELLNSND